ncbi:hypothetical protein [Halonatronum saccharophilum]|uniref:hypothetical protein n=1 Tax=Halonatronum saccharophilum TaxID=150060 RepID=UPI000487C2CA|nr:hypothetical protein [Halonatronum saccharophilum]
MGDIMISFGLLIVLFFLLKNLKARGVDFGQESPYLYLILGIIGGIVVGYFFGRVLYFLMQLNIA